METLVKRNGLVPAVSTLFDDFFSKDVFNWGDKNYATLGTNLPSVNLKETDTKLEVELAAPGLKREDFKVEIENNMLVISSEKQEEKKEEKKEEGFVRKEFNYQSFYRSFILPDYIDENKIDATYKDGILHVVIAKKDGGKKKPIKTISIK
jgi:HSP20 family protein